ncbi:MAG TPA: lipid-binding SYLF domain-containing protein [Acidobacteriota bacterium]|nr:lipid-binding SYLF domain-containing protein [Acidobacteriota bacterium]
MKKIFWSFVLMMLLSIPVLASKGKQIERLQESATVLSEVMNIPEEGIPRDLLKKSECMVIIPSMKKAAFGVGGNYGRGCLVCRIKDKWSPPVMVVMTGGSLGFQLGGSSTDVILLIMNERGVNKLLESKVTLGADASAAAGPKGRTAQAATDVQMRAEILSYARSRGLFAGVSLQGAVLKPSSEDNEDLYGKKIDYRKVLYEGGSMPKSATKLIKVLQKYDQP